MTLPGSLLDQFAGPRGYRKVELQLDDENTTAGRHSGPLTRGSLYPLALAGVDLRSWIAGTFLSDEEIHTAWKTGRLHPRAGRSGPRQAHAAASQSLGRRGALDQAGFRREPGQERELGLKIVIGEKPFKPRGLRAGSRIPVRRRERRRHWFAPRRLSGRGAEAPRPLHALPLHAVHPLRGVRHRVSAPHELRHAA